MVVGTALFVSCRIVTNKRGLAIGAGEDAKAERGEFEVYLECALCNHLAVRLFGACKLWLVWKSARAWKVNGLNS
jgi:hypothetical protein